MICVDYTKDYVAKGVYVEAFDVSDPLTGEGSYVYEHYDEIVNLVTGGQNIKIEKDTEYANSSGLKNILWLYVLVISTNNTIPT